MMPGVGQGNGGQRQEIWGEDRMVFACGSAHSDLTPTFQPSFSSILLAS